MEPLPTLHSGYTKNIASQRIFEMPGDRDIAHPPSEKINFYHLFRGGKSAASTGGWFFESQVHHSHRRERSIRLFPILGERTCSATS